MFNKKMKTFKTIVSIILIILGCINTGIFLLFSLVGKFICGHFFEVINGSNGPIPTCENIFNTDFVFVLILGIVLLAIGVILLLARGRSKSEK